MDICNEKKSTLLPLDENSLSIRREVTFPHGFQFLSHLFKTFAAFPQLINPTKGCQRSDPQLPSYSPIRKFFNKALLPGNAWILRI